MVQYQPVDPSDQQSKFPTGSSTARTMSEKKTSRVYWHAPTTMLATFLLGLLFAIGHDRFYHHYDHQPVGSNLEQKVIVNVGTAFAFMVKMFFAISTATVFAQQIWLSLKRRAESIDDIDALFDILGNVLHFGRVTLWARHWGLAMIALITWCIPLAAVFTPGTIQVQPDVSYQNNTLLKPAQPQQSWHATQNYAATQIDYTALQAVDNITYGDVINNGPSGNLYSVALGSVTRRDVLSIPPPSLNSSYDLSFFGPSLSCDNMSANQFSTFNASLAKAYKAQFLPGMATILGGVENTLNEASLVLKYNAWVETSEVDYGKPYNLSNPNWNNDTSTRMDPSSANTLYFYLSSNRLQYNSSVLVACHLHNATYSVSFSFENSQQSINVRSVAIGEEVPYNAKVDIEEPNYDNIVYNSVLHAFNNIVIAAATNDTGTKAPNVLYYGGPVGVSALQDYIEAKPSKKLTADAVIQTLQEMFQNITLSTMASPSLRLPDSQAQFIRTNTWRSVNIYIYEPSQLYIAYGCALLASFFCLLWGLYVSLYHNHASYNIGFSTILRTTRRNEMGGIVNTDARKGDQPVPKEMRTVRLKYIVGETRSGGEGFALVHDHGRIRRVVSEGNSLMVEEK
ncbi:MAG: hypothetical protein M1816_006239 [Peltula sp. TS41687]|nr:MAG: hypothetical protein M1816_006239 [Peltula sp. TS41687]